MLVTTSRLVKNSPILEKKVTAAVGFAMCTCKFLRKKLSTMVISIGDTSRQNYCQKWKSISLRLTFCLNIKKNITGKWKLKTYFPVLPTRKYPLFGNFKASVNRNSVFVNFDYNYSKTNTYFASAYLSRVYLIIVNLV